VRKKKINFFSLFLASDFVDFRLPAGVGRFVEKTDSVKELQLVISRTATDHRRFARAPVDRVVRTSRVTDSRGLK
jgi:hypothetical protein